MKGGNQSFHHTVTPVPLHRRRKFLSARRHSGRDAVTSRRNARPGGAGSRRGVRGNSKNRITIIVCGLAVVGNRSGLHRHGRHVSADGATITGSSPYRRTEARRRAAPTNGPTSLVGFSLKTMLILERAVISPLRFAFEQEHRVGVIEVTFLDNPRLVVEALGRIVQEPGFRPELDLCIEFKSLTQVPSMTRLRDLVLRLRRFGLGHFRGRCALVAWTPEARDAARRFVELLGARSSRLRVFSHCDEALRWFRDAGRSTLGGPGSRSETGVAKQARG